MRPVLILFGACCLLAAYACDSPAPPNQPSPQSGATAPTAGEAAATSTPLATLTPSAPPASAATPWAPPTALAGTPIPGAEATLTAAPVLTRTTLTITNSRGERVNMLVEVADTEPSRELGLMFRPSMPPDEGMLFVFEGDTTSAFWMENTILPLSIAFIDASGKILDIHDMQPLDRNTTNASAPYHYALETNQGFFRVHDIVAGNQVAIGTTQSVVIPGMPGCGR